MDDLGSWLSSMVWPLVSRAFVSLGVGYATFTGADTALGAAIDAAKSAAGGLPADVALIVARFGFFDFMSITSGGIVSGLAWMAMKRFVVTNTGQGAAA